MKEQVEKIDREALVKCKVIDGSCHEDAFGHRIDDFLSEQSITPSRIVDIKLSESMAMNSLDRDNFNRTCLIFYV